MSKIKRIVIEFYNLTDAEQLDLFFMLHDYAEKNLPSEKTLMVFTIPKEKNEVKQ